jgi:hypothetical protein
MSQLKEMVRKGKLAEALSDILEQGPRLTVVHLVHVNALLVKIEDEAFLRKLQSWVITELKKELAVPDEPAKGWERL